MPDNTLPPVLARAGAKPEIRIEDPWEECAYWKAIYLTREYDTFFKHRGRISLSRQWIENTDLIDVDRDVRLNWDYDFKRQLMAYTERNGVLTADTTVPWSCIDEFEAFRDDFEQWRHKKRRCLRSKQDFEDFMHYRIVLLAHRQKVQERSSSSTPLFQTLLAAWAYKHYGLPGGNYRKTAAWLAENGFYATKDSFTNAKRRVMVEEGSICQLETSDKALLALFLDRFPEANLQPLFRPGSTAHAFVSQLQNDWCQTTIPQTAGADTGQQPMDVSGIPIRLELVPRAGCSALVSEFCSAPVIGCLASDPFYLLAVPEPVPDWAQDWDAGE